MGTSSDAYELNQECARIKTTILNKRYRAQYKI